MDQQGVTPTAGIQTIDRLRYNYENNEESNRLIRVADSTTNYGLGDFENPNGAGNDYSYDKNGNLEKDANKGIEKISYTFFNKPARILFSNGNSIEYSYDAAGGKVQELVKKAGQPDKVTDYIGAYVYEGNVQRYIQTPEGRSVRDINANTYKEEYFVKDHLGNVRSTIDVVQKPILQYLATYELASANLEGLYFEQLNEIRDDKPGSINPNDQKSGKLNGQDRPVGTSLLMHVMAGDQVELNVNNYYDSYNPNTDNPISASSMLSSIVSTLTGGIGGFQGSEGHNPDMVQQLFQPGNYLSEYQGILNGATDQSRPRAYLNYILFDENMQIDKSFSNVFQVNSTGSWEQIGTTAPLTIPANGYLAVYLSNQSQGVGCYDCATVHFDQLQVRLQKGSQLEESHYYPFGLPMAGLSSAAENNTIAQRRKYQSNEYIKDLGLNWMDFNARQYDPQLGRFLGVDPLAASGGQDMFSPYAAMGNAPESMVDPNGTSFESPNAHREINDLWQPASVQKSPFQDIFGGGGNGGRFNLSGSESVVTLYGANAQSFWAWHIGSKAIQGSSQTATNLSVDGGGLGTGEGLVPANAIGVSNNGTSSTYKWYTGGIEDLELHSIIILNSKPEKEKGVGEPGLAEGFIPIWGSGRAAINDFQNGRWGWGIFNTAMAISDVFLVKTLYTGIVKAGVMGGSKLGIGAAKGGNRAFWSGVGTEAAALEKGFETLGQTRAGRNLIKLTADMPYYPGSQAYNMWARLSTAYAKGAKGVVHVFQNAEHGVGMQSIWRLYEYPALKANPNVTKIIFHH